MEGCARARFRRAGASPSLDARRRRRFAMDAARIREFQKSDLDAIVEISLRAWAPVFDSLREVLGDPIFFRLKPDWRSAQAEEVTTSCTSDERDAFVAVVDRRPVGFVTVALNTFHEQTPGISTL